MYVSSISILLGHPRPWRSEAAAGLLGAELQEFETDGLRRGIGELSKVQIDAA